MAPLIWAEPAIRQLEAILEFIALDNPEAAISVSRKIFDATDKMEHFKQMGRPIPEFP